ncbi:MAG: GNAT family N-acetyltransferase [Acidobacteria bacterium]|nr:GNAT family N-acetyltransferase [Acidobacteriota bacterium]
MKGKSREGAASSPMRQDSNHSRVPDIRVVRSLEEFPPGINVAGLAKFLHHALKPFEDSLEDIERGIMDCLTAKGRRGGFLLIARSRRKPVAALVMQRTGMQGYVPENLLLFVAVAPEQRNRGLGRLLVERAVQEARGDIKLHVEYDNPARRLYERLGFTSKYAEMRYVK